MRVMRCALLLLLAALGGCAPVAGLAGADIASVAVLGRGLGDIGVSAITGRDCSIVRLDAGKTYCAPRDEVPIRQPFCTRTIGVATCWADPYVVPQQQQEYGYTPPPTDEQLRYRSTRWPKSLFF